MMKTVKQSLRGVTLVEIAIVLVIIGLLLGGILKGQELINNARIRAISDRQAGLKVAWFAFIDRYRGLPGDYVLAEQNIPGSGPIRSGGVVGRNSGDGFIDIQESPIVFQHLTGAGYLRCPVCTSSIIGAPTALNSLVNAYGGVMAIFVDSQYYSTFGASRDARMSSQTGPSIPSNIIRDVDIKTDDGLPVTGNFNHSAWAGAAAFAGGNLNCMSQSSAVTGAPAKAAAAVNKTAIWRHADLEVLQNCSGTVQF